MKIPLLSTLLACCVLARLAASAAEETKTGTAAPARASAGDAAWAEFEKMLNGPTEQPKSREDAIAMMKEHLIKLDKMAIEFLQNYPHDPRRWKLPLTMMDSNRLRPLVGLPAKSLSENKTMLADILAAPDADAETKSVASYNSVVIAAEETKSGNGTLQDLEKAIEAHRKAYPDFKANSQLDRLVAVVKADTDIKAKPLELKFTAVDGREVDLSKMRGKVVLVDFWATWCGPCMEEVPNVVKAYEKLHDKGFEIVGISFDEDKARVQSVTKEKGMTWPQFFDGKGWQNEFGQKFTITSIPRMWLVNKKGSVVDTDGREDLAGKVENA